MSTPAPAREDPAGPLSSAPPAPAPAARSESALSRLLVPLGAAACLLPFVTTGAGLLLGLGLALTAGNPHLERTRRWTPTLLAVSVVGLGAGMDLRAVARAGAHGFLFTVAGIGLALALGAVFSRLFRVGRQVGTLITVGTAICGGSAIAALVPVLRPRQHETSVALGTVFLLNAVALFAFPALGRLAGLSDAQFGLWSALAIHDTSSVVGAALAWGGKAVETATTVKLARALWIVPLTFAVGQWQARSGGPAAAAKPRRPWFIAGFVAAAALVTWVPGLQQAGHLTAAVARQALVVTLFLIGTSLTRASLREVGARPLALGVALWVAMAGLSLAAIALHLVA